MNMEYGDRFQVIPKVGIAVVAILVLLVAFLAVFFLTMWVNVPVGNAVVMVDPVGGKISGPIRGPTWATKAPWVNAVQISIAVDTLGMWGDGYDPTADLPTVKSFSKDQLEMQIDIMMRWRLDASKVTQLYVTTRARRTQRL